MRKHLHSEFDYFPGPFIGHLRLSVKLGRQCVELHYGTVLGTLSLILLAVTKLRSTLGSNLPAKSYP